jgi:hypothetical protein
MRIRKNFRYFWVILLILLLPRPTFSYDRSWVLASTLRGEAPEDCLACRELTACALVKDSLAGINIRTRWYGWRPAREQDKAMIEQAFTGEICSKYPECKFVGNGRDLEVWARKGWIRPTSRVIAYCSKGCTVCVPAEKQMVAE